MKLIIAGSRSIPPEIADKLVELGVGVAELHGWQITEVVSGKAPKGIDAAGERWADAYGVPVKSFPADWANEGRRAGFLRNGEMGDYGEGLLAITTGSPGTRSMIEIARERKLPTIVISIERTT